MHGYWNDNDNCILYVCPFEITADPFYRVENMARLEKAKRDVENGKTALHELMEIEDE